MSKATIGSYKGHPTISLDADSKYPFTFGLAKAKLIVEHIEAIRAFVARQERPIEPAPDASLDRDYEDRCARQCGLM